MFILFPRSFFYIFVFILLLSSLLFLTFSYKKRSFPFLWINKQINRFCVRVDLTCFDHESYQRQTWLNLFVRNFMYTYMYIYIYIYIRIVPSLLSKGIASSLIQCHGGTIKGFCQCNGRLFKKSRSYTGNSVLRRVREPNLALFLDIGREHLCPYKNITGISSIKNLISGHLSRSNKTDNLRQREFFPFEEISRCFNSDYLMWIFFYSSNTNFLFKFWLVSFFFLVAGKKRKIQAGLIVKKQILKFVFSVS